jgi:MFS family permease
VGSTDRAGFAGLGRVRRDSAGPPEAVPIRPGSVAAVNRPALSTRDRRALAAVAAQFFVNGAMTASFIARAPQIRDRIGVTVDRFGLLLTVAGLFGLLGSLLAGRVVHRFGTYRVLLVGAVVMVVALPAIGLARSATFYLLAMMAYMTVDVLVDISMNLQGSWLSARRHTPVMNRLHGLWSLGAFTGGLGAAVANGLDASLPVHLAVVAAVTALLLVAVSRGLLRTDEDGHDDTRDRPVVAPVGRRARLVPLVLLVLGGMFAIVVELTGGDWAAFRLADDLDASAAVASAAFVAYTIGMTLVRFGGDFLQPRLGRMGLHRWSVAAATAGLALASLVNVSWVSIAGFALIGAGVATFLPKLYDDAARLPGRRGAGLGAMTAGSRIAALSTPVLVGGIAGTSWSVGAAIAVVTLPCAIGFVLVTEASEHLLRPSAGTGADE